LEKLSTYLLFEFDLLLEFDEICWGLIVGVRRENGFKAKMTDSLYVLICKLCIMS
jgi:hypothetical protein